MIESVRNGSMTSPVSCKAAAAKLGGADEDEEGPADADTDGVAEVFDDEDSDEDVAGSPVYKLSASWFVSVSNIWLTSLALNWSPSRESSRIEEPDDPCE